jgi:peptidoglycan/LPS O-acetylase OafA/YrhL
MPGGQRIDTPDCLTFVRNLFFLQGWNAYTAMINGPLWSLSVEVFYYALVPVFVRLNRWVLAALIALSAVKFWTLSPISPQLSWNLHGETMFGMAWAWLAGFYWYRYRGEVARIVLVGLSCLLMIQKFSALSPVTATVSWAVLASASALRVPLRLRAPLRYLGEISYPLYAIHWPTIVGMYALFHVTRPIAWVAAALCMSVIAYHAVDRPFRKGVHIRHQARAGLGAALAGDSLANREHPVTA